MRLASFVAALGLLTVAAFHGAAPMPAAPLQSASFQAPPPDRTVLSFDLDWRFLKADAPGAEQSAFDDSSWRTLNVPHDWSIEGPFDADAPAGGAGAFLPTGVGWYRKHFTLPLADKGRRVFVDFDGVMANSDVWINGSHLSHRPYGYVSFRDALTGHLHYGPGAANVNVLAVRADTSAQPASRWYAGSGITRHVRLVITDPVHLGHWATFITTPQAAADHAVVHVQTAVVNQGAAPRTVRLQVAVFGPDDRRVETVDTAPQTVAPGASAAFGEDLSVPTPKLWDLAHPVLYHAVTRVQSGGATLDAETTPFGIREFHFDPDTGFYLNGVPHKIKGVCLHGDMGGLGVAVPLGAWKRRLAALKSLGVNAIRTSHNPVAPEFLDLCDRMGFLVMDEYFDCWTVAKNPDDYHLYFRKWATVDTRDMVMRDRNHPSIILYSAGNEIHDTPKPDIAIPILASLIAVYHKYDPTRPVTQALFRPNVSGDYTDGLADMLDVVGQNYREPEILAAHAQKPTRKIIGTENGHARTEWLALRDNPPYAGQFLWTGADYLGEARRLPTIGGASGLMDRTNIVRPRGRERESWWLDTPMVSIARARPLPPVEPGGDASLRIPQDAADWSPADQSPHTETVDVYSNCAQVELFLNGRSLGAQPLHADASPRSWPVTYAPGTLKAVGINGGQVVATEELHSAGPAAQVVLVADQTTLPQDFDDVSYVRALVEDAHGILVPTATDEITFHVSGPGRIAAVDNGDRDTTEPFQASARLAYQGQCVAILKSTASTGTITVTATAPGLASGTVTLHALPAVLETK